MSKLWIHIETPFSESQNFKRPAIGKVFLSTDTLCQRYHCWKWQPVWVYKLCNCSLIYWGHGLGSLIGTYYGHKHLLLFVVGIVNMLRAGQSGVQLPAELRDIFLFKNIQTCSYSRSRWVHSGVWWLGHKINHLPPSSADITSEQSSNCTLPVCFHGDDRDITFFYCTTFGL
jgi:hypothetical protein